MNLSLRAARRLENRICEKLREGVDTTKSFNIFQHPEISNMSPEDVQVSDIADSLTRAQNQTENQIEERLALINVRFRLRREIGEANADFGINKNVALRKTILEELAFIRDVLLSVQDNDEELDYIGIVNKIRTLVQNPSRLSYGLNETVSVSTLTLTYIEKLRSLVRTKRKALEDIEDKLAALNAGTTISLNETDQQFLAEMQLL